MKKEIIQMAITGEDGQTSISGHYPVSLNLTMMTIAKIEKAEGFENPDNTLQVCLECEALDSSGSVFSLYVNFVPANKFDQANLLNEFIEGAIHIFEGDYGIIEKEPVVTLDPQYKPLGDEYIEKDFRMAFRINR